MRRRRVLGAAVGLLSAAVAGCTDGGSIATEAPDDAGDGGETVTGGSPTDTEPSDTEPSDTEPSDTDSAGSDFSGDDLDLREANVTGVDFEQRDGGEYGFSVTLFHHDDGEDGFANWWQVETVDGDRLGRRDLAHSHGTREFTRSETIEVPDDVDCVVVRGHDRTHEYGGQAALVDLASAAVTLRRQGGEPDAFDETDCP